MREYFYNALENVVKNEGWNASWIPPCYICFMFGIVFIFVFIAFLWDFYGYFFIFDETLVHFLSFFRFSPFFIFMTIFTHFDVKSHEYIQNSTNFNKFFKSCGFTWVFVYFFLFFSYRVSTCKPSPYIFIYIVILQQ